MSNAPNQHVVPRDSGWAVMPANGKQASGLFNTKEEAQNKAKEIAHNNNSNVVVHGKDAKIQEIYAPQEESFVNITSTGLQPAQHVVPHDDGWAVQTEGKQQPALVTKSKYSAIREAHERANTYGSTLIIHNEDGTFRRIDEAPHFPSAAADALHLR